MCRAIKEYIMAYDSMNQLLFSKLGMAALLLLYTLLYYFLKSLCFASILSRS
jgi:hypothetical protein